MPGVRTTRFVIAAATMEMLLGLVMYTYPDALGHGLWSPLTRMTPYLAAGLAAGGIAMFLTIQEMPHWLRRQLAILAAIPFVVAAFSVGVQGRWTNTVHFGLLAAGVALGPWLDRHATDDSPDLFNYVLAASLIWESAVLLLRPGFLDLGTVGAILPVLPLAGIASLLGAASLLLPSAGTGLWAPRGLLRQVLSAILPLTLTYAMARSGSGFSLILWGVWALVALVGEAVRSRRHARLRAVPEAQWDPFPAQLERVARTWMWLLVLLVVLITAVGGEGAVASPNRASLFVLSVSVYNVITSILLPDLAHPGRAAERHLAFLTVAISLLMLDTGHLGEIFLASFVMVTPLAARSGGRPAGLRMLGLGSVVIIMIMFHHLAQAAPVGVSVTHALLQLLALYGVGMVGIRSGQAERGMLEELTVQRDHLEDALAQARRAEASNERLVAILDASPDLVAITDRNGRRTYMNRAGREMLGLGEAEEARGGDIGAVHPPWARRRVMEEGIPAALRDGVWQGESAYLGARGEEIPVSQVIIAHRAEDGTVDRLSTVVRDMRNWKRAEQALRHSEERFRSAFDNAPIGVALVHFGGRIIEANRALCEMLGHSEAEMQDASLTDFIDEPQAQEYHEYGYALETGDVSRLQAEWRFIHKQGQTVWAMAAISRVGGTGDAPGYVVVQLMDITARKVSEAQLLHLATYDPLTDLLNRRAFHEELELQLQRAERDGTAGALLFLDLDQFKYVNDSLGHQAGDTLLKNLATLLKGQLTTGDLLARLGGDEFAFLLPNTDASEAAAFAQQVLDAMRRHVAVVTGTPVTSTASIGVALYPADGQSAEALLARADFAMYAAKEQGRNRYATSAEIPWQQVELGSKLAWERRIREALAGDGLVLYLQPIASLRSGKVEQYELLLRMRGEDGRLIPPGAFLPVAERFGLIQQIDRWVVQQAIRMIADAGRRGHKLRLEVNLSARAFEDADLLPLVRQHLAETGIDPAALVLEITETAAIADFQKATGFMQTLRALGCRFAIDDFGAGFSSFSYLKRLPVDYLKLDGSFIRDLPRDPVDQQMVRAMVEMARGLGLQTIAEFVEDEETLQLLRRYGVDFAQGYYIGKPGPIPEA